jgi:predicted oxidoreductase
MIPGDIGSMRGLSVDGDARVTNASGAPIPGLYAVGTVATSVTAGTYPGAGTMLGPSITFGFLAARHIAGVLAPESVATGSTQSA